MSPRAAAVAYWLTFAAAGAFLCSAFNSNANWGSHMGSNAALGTWFVSMIASGASVAGGGILAIFRQSRHLGIVFVAAGLGGALAGAAFALSWTAR